MKVYVDYKLAIQSIEKFHLDQKLTAAEKECLDDVLNACIGDIIPDAIELDQHEKDKELMNSFDPGSKVFAVAKERNRIFENKYC